MSSKEISDEIKTEIGQHKYIEAVNGRVPHSTLTDKQWRLWYDEQVQRKKSYLLGEYKERRIVTVEGAFILTNGTFIEPIVEAVYDFESVEMFNELNSVLERRYGQKDKKSND